MIYFYMLLFVRHWQPWLNETKCSVIIICESAKFAKIIATRLRFRLSIRVWVSVFYSLIQFNVCRLAL